MNKKAAGPGASRLRNCRARPIGTCFTGPVGPGWTLAGTACSIYISIGTFLCRTLIYTESRQELTWPCHSRRPPAEALNLLVSNYALR